jgi:putative hemolysin
VSLRDGGGAAAEVWRTVSVHLHDTSLPQVTPRQGYPLTKLDEAVLPARLPPLIKGYLNLGAKVCGEPAWDPDFNAADFPILMEMNRMDDRYRRRLGLPESPK